MIWKMLVGIVGGVISSTLLYPLTHGERRRLPELFGLAAGCLLLDVWLYWVWRDEESAWRAFTSQAVVGLGVAANRVRLEFASANG